MATRITYRPDIDGLRAVAVVAVICCHAGLGFPGGYVGVDVFFVISGYLITSLILKELRQETFSPVEFWERRIRRIFPALAVVTAATCAAGWLFLMPEAYAALGKSVAALALLASNLHFWRATGYFSASAAEKPLLHTWSLAVEEQFYLFLPTGLLLLARFRRLNRAPVLLALGALISLLLSVYGTYRDADAAFYLLPARAWELFAGALLAFTPPSWPTMNPGLRSLGAYGGFGLILASCLLYTEATRFPGLAAVPPVLGAGLLIWAGMPAGKLPAVNRLLSRNPVVFVGLISYSLYLWHWPLLAFARARSIGPLSLHLRLTLVMVSVVGAWLSWRFVETPFRKRAVFRARSRLLAVSAAAFAVLLGFGGVAAKAGGFPGRLPSRALFFVSTGRLDPAYTPDLGIADVPEQLIHLGFGSAAPRVLVWGDSHAKAILPAFDALCRERGVAARAATHSSTAPVLDYYFARSEFGLGDRSPAWNAAVLQYACSSRVKSVVLVANWSSYLADRGFWPALLKTVDELRSAGLRVSVMDDVPRFDCDVPRALALLAWRGEDLTRLAMPPAHYAEQTASWRARLPELAQHGAMTLDPGPFLRDSAGGGAIVPYDEGGSRYADDWHLSPHGALRLKKLCAPTVE